MESPQQGTVPQIAQEQPAARLQPGQRSLHHRHEIRAAGEILGDGVDDDQIEAAGHAVKIGGLPVLQSDMPEPAPGGAGFQPLDDGAGEVQPVIMLDLGASPNRIIPVPEPISSTRRGFSARSRSSVSSSQDRISNAGIGVLV